MVASNLQYGVDSLSGRKGGHLDRPATQTLSRNTTRGIDMKYIELTQGKRAIVDDEDFEWLNRWKWRASKDHYGFYAIRTIKKKGKTTTVLMHRIIIKVPPNLQTDHRNGNGLDNQKSNLRACTQAQNTHNRGARKNVTSRYKGVYLKYKNNNNGRLKWGAHIRKGNARFDLGYYCTEAKAAKAYDAKAKELYGEFAYLNAEHFPELKN